MCGGTPASPCPSRTFLRVVDLARVNSRSPSSPWKRPNPLSPTPPNGRDGMPTNVSTELIVVPPARSFAAISGPRLAENTEEPSPNDVPFARRTASSTSGTVLITNTGPKVSSCTAEQFSGTSTRTIGLDVRRLDRFETPDECGRAGVQRVGDVAPDDVDLRRQCHRAVVRQVLEPDPQRGRLLLHQAEELLADRLHDVDPLDADAALAGVPVSRPRPQRKRRLRGRRPPRRRSRPCRRVPAGRG